MAGSTEIPRGESVSELLWHGWVKGFRWQTRLLEGLGVIGKKRYKEGSKVIEYCIVDDDGLARLMRYWPDTDAWYPDKQFGKRCVEDSFTLSDHNNNQTWGDERDRRLSLVYGISAALPDVWPDSVSDIVRTWSTINRPHLVRVA